MNNTRGNIMNVKQTKAVNKNASLAVSFSQSNSNRYLYLGCTIGEWRTSHETQARKTLGKHPTNKKYT